MKIIIPRQKNFDDNNTGLKIAGGVAAAGALFAGAKHGYLGNSAMKHANSAWGNVGKVLGSNSMKKSGAIGIARAEANAAHGALEAVKKDGNKVIEWSKNSKDWKKKYKETYNQKMKDFEYDYTKRDKMREAIANARKQGTEKASKKAAAAAE